MACVAARADESAVQVSHATKGRAGAAIDSDAEPTRASALRRSTTDAKEEAAVRNSSEMPLHAAAAANIGAGPAPAYMQAELTSGGRAPKSNSESCFGVNALSVRRPPVLVGNLLREV